MKTVYYHGTVYTGTLPLVEAFVVEDGRFLMTGSSDECLAAAPDAEKVDLNGKFVCCGFNDSHMHLLNFGQSLLAARLGEHTTSLADLIAYLKEYLAEHPRAEGAWLTGRGWNHDYFTDVKREPNRYDLDQVSKDVPIVAVRCCGHCLAVNSKVLELLGIDSQTPQVEGGSIGMENGEPNGLFYDNAMSLVYSAVPMPTKDALKEMIRRSCQALNAYGVTSSQSDDYCVFRSIPWQTINEAFQELEQSGELTVRVYEQSNFTTVESLAKFVEAGNVTGVGSNLFKIGPLKMLGDGSLGARTAYLKEPYSDDPSTCGFPVFTQEMVTDMVSFANNHNMQVAIHAIGDAGLEQVLTAVEAALKENPRPDHRHGVVHCQISSADQLQKIADLNMHVYAQPIFLDYDNHMVEARVGKDRASTSYAWKTLMNKGVHISSGTDCPVELPNALGCIQCAVTRTTLHDHVGPYLPQEAFTVQEAIDSYTIESARASFEEGFKGAIRPGYLADFVVLSENLFTIDPSTINDVKICATYLGGKQVFKA